MQGKIIIKNLSRDVPPSRWIHDLLSRFWAWQLSLAPFCMWTSAIDFVLLDDPSNSVKEYFISILEILFPHGNTSNLSKACSFYS